MAEQDQQGNKPKKIKDPVQKMLQVMHKERRKLTAELLVKREALSTVTTGLCEFSVLQSDCTEIVLKILKDLGKIIGTENDESLEAFSDSNFHFEEAFINTFRSTELYAEKIKIRVQNFVLKFRKLESVQKTLISKISKNKECIQTLQKTVEKTEASKRDLQIEMLEEKEAMRRDFDKQMDQLRNAHHKQVSTLQAEISEKQKKIDELEQMQAKHVQIMHLSEERALSKKELEDMEDAYSRDIKTVKMRQLFIGHLQTKIQKSVNSEQQKIVENGYRLTMENITALRNDIGKLQDSVRQQNLTLC